MAIKERGQNATQIVNKNVSQTAPTDGQILAFNSTSNEWESTTGGSGLTTEQVEDIVGAMVSGNTETNISVTYEDGDGTLDFVATDTQLTTEQVQDIVGGMVTGNTETNISVTYDDSDGTLDFVATDTTGPFTDGSSVIYPTTITDKLGLGTQTPDTDLEVSKDDGNAEITVSSYHDTEATTPKITFRKADGSESSPALVDDDAVLGTIAFKGYDGNSFDEGARIEARIQGTASDPTDMPTELTFWTSPNGSSTCTERMTISQDGSVMLGTTSSTTPIHLLELKASDTSDSTTIAAACTDGLALNMGGGVATDEFAPAVSWYSIDGNLDAAEKTCAAITAQAAETFDAADDSGSDLVFFTHKIATSSGLTEKVRITAGGNFGVGTDDPKVAADVHHDPTGLAGDTGGGEVVKFGTGSLTAGKLYYLNSSGAWTLTDANAVASGASQLLGLALGTSATTHGMLIRGFFDVASYLTGTFVQGAAVYISETTTGNIDVAAPAGSGDFVRIVGHATNTANVIYFNPSQDWIEL